MSSIPPPADIRLDQLAKLAGLSALVIRAWERRYGFPIAQRTPGGHRRYSRAQADAVRQAAILVRAGFRAADAIARVRSGHPPATVDVQGVARVSRLLVDRDAAATLNELRGAWLTVGLESTLEDLVLPALRKVGDEWSARRLTVADEHVATGAVMSWLGAIRAELPSPELGRPVYVIATPEGEEHGVGVWALELLLRARGVASLPLGISVPVDDIVEVARRVGARGIVLAIFRPSLKRTLGAVAALAANGRRRTRVYAAGPGATTPLPDGVDGLPGTLTAAADFLAAAARPTRRRIDLPVAPP